MVTTHAVTCPTCNGRGVIQDDPAVTARAMGGRNSSRVEMRVLLVVR